MIRHWSHARQKGWGYPLKKIACQSGLRFQRYKPLKSVTTTGRPLILRFFQTEAERRRREAGVQQAIENGFRLCLYVCMYVCMFFKDISRSRALGESKVVSCCSPVNSTLHKHDIIRMWFPTSARHVKIGKKCFLECAFKKMHVNLSSSILSVRKTGVTEK